MRSLRDAVTAAAAPPVGTAAAITVEGGDDLTHGDWAARSSLVAGGLLARGVGPGSRVALCFAGRRWADFAVAWLGVGTAGAGAVLLSPGAAAADLSRAFAHSGAVGLLWGGAGGPPAVGGWVAGVDELEAVPSSKPLDVSPPPAEVGYAAAPLAPAWPWSDPEGTAVIVAGGSVVHAWAPGSAAGQAVLRAVLAGEVSASTLAVFDADRLCRLVAARGAEVLGLTPALAAGLLASGAAARHDLSSVARVVLSGTPSAGLRAGLRTAFAGTDVDVLAPAGGVRPAGAPIAVSQEGMLWHEQFNPGSFNLPCLVRRYRGPLDVAAFQWALRELARRHEPLRTTFALAGAEPAQVVGDRFDVGYDDLGELAAGERDSRVDELLAGATARPFDLTAGPLFEPRIVRLGADDHLLVVRLHHTVFDDWSVDVFRRELSALYAAARAGVPSPLVEPPTTFTAAIRRRRAAMAGAAGEAQRAWWRDELAGAPLAVQLPLAGAGPAPEPGEPLRIELATDLVDRIRTLAPRLRATPFMTVLAAFSAQLARVTGQDDLVLATVVAHRDTTDVEPLLGCFTKKVPLRLRVDGEPTFTELVARTRRSLLGALAHQDVAFEAALVEGLGASAAAHGVVPHVAVVFQAEAPQRVRLRLPGLAIGLYEAPAGARAERHFSAGPDAAAGAPVWGDGVYLGTFLILSLAESDDGMALIARGVLDRPATHRFLADFEALLRDVVADPDRPVSTPARPAPPADLLDLRGFRVSRRRLEAALRTCAGVADVAVAVRDDRLVAYVVADAGGTPSMAAMRRALWTALPGAPWPSAVAVVDTLDGDLAGASLAGSAVDPAAGLLAAMWAEIAGRAVGPSDSWWQDFSFLHVLAEVREAGMAIPEETVVHCRTPEMLAALL